MTGIAACLKVFAKLRKEFSSFYPLFARNYRKLFNEDATILISEK